MIQRIWFFGSGVIAVPTLEALAKTTTVLGVVTQPDRPKGRGQRVGPTAIKEAAQQLGLLIRDPRSPDDPGLMDEIRHATPELLVVMAYGGLLPSDLLAIPTHGAVNVHPSLLPKYRGAAPIPWAILNGDPETGITIFQMDAQLDHGPILLQERLPIGPEETTETLSRTLSQTAPAVLTKALKALGDGTARPILQDDRAATRAPRLTKADAWINWALPAEAIARRVRAMNPWPGTMTSWQGYALKILRVTVIAGSAAPPGASSGEILDVGPEGIVVKAGEGALKIQMLQLAGGRPLDAAAFLRGHPMRRGHPLGPEPDTIDVR